MNQKAVDARTHVDRSGEGLHEVGGQSMVGIESLGEGYTFRVNKWKKDLQTSEKLLWL